MSALAVPREATAFAGFAQEDFAVFTVPGFAERMALLRQRIKPKLVQIGEMLTGPISAGLGDKLYPHVAQHLRRSVNPPVATWVAFARSARAYKPYTHLRVAVHAGGVRVVVFVEDDADDKPLFAENLQRSAGAFAKYFSAHPSIESFEMCDLAGQPLRGKGLSSARLRAFGERLSRVKAQHSSFGVQFDKADPAVACGSDLLDAVVEAAATTLQPLYRCGTVARYSPGR